MWSDTNKFNVLFMASSNNVGLTFNLARLAIALKKFGHKVIVVSEPKEEEKGLFDELKSRGVEWYTECAIDHLSINKTFNAARSMGKIIDECDIEVIHAQGIRHLLVAFLASKIFCRKKKIGIVVNIHSTLHGKPYENVALLVESFLLRTCADLAISVAKSVANKLVKFGLSSNKVVTVYNGIDLELFDEIRCGDEYLSLLPADLKSCLFIVVGYFASLISRKGHKYLIEAISEVSKEFPNIRLVITGSGPLRDKLKILSKNLGIEKKVLFTGKIEYKYLYQLLNKIDVYAFPSLAELFPFAILEAMAAGKPIVATRVGGMPEAIRDGENGILVPPRDYKSLADGIKRLIKNPTEAERMGKKSRKLVEEKFDIQKIAYDLSECYRLCREKKS